MKKYYLLSCACHLGNVGCQRECLTTNFTLNTQAVLLIATVYKYRYNPLLTLPTDWVYPIGSVVSFPTGIPGTSLAFAGYLSPIFVTHFCSVEKALLASNVKTRFSVFRVEIVAIKVWAYVTFSLFAHSCMHYSLVL